MVETVGPFLLVYLCNLYAPGIPSRDGHETSRYTANGMMENYNRRGIDKSFAGLAEAAWVVENSSPNKCFEQPKIIRQDGIRFRWR
jgi:hypothetical protein